MWFMCRKLQIKFIVFLVFDVTYLAVTYTIGIHLNIRNDFVSLKEIIIIYSIN